MIVQSGSFGNEAAVICTFHRKKYFIREHIHQFSEVVYMISGEMTVTIDGVCETASAGDFIIIPPLSVHSYHTPVYNEHWMCSFSSNFVLDILSEKELYTKRKQCVFKASDNLRAYIEGRLYDSSEKALALTPELMRSFKAILHAVFEEYMSKIPEEELERQHSNTISKIVEYISLHYMERITLASVGKGLGYSIKYVSNCIGNIEGFNFRHLVNSFRVEKAENLLRTTDLKIIDIAFECGFCSERSFRRVFMQIAKQSPGEYRRKSRKI